MHQLVVAGFQLYVLLRRRELVLLALCCRTADTLFAVVNLYFYRGLPVAVPGARFNAVLFAILFVAILIALNTSGLTI